MLPSSYYRRVDAPKSRKRDEESGLARVRVRFRVRVWVRVSVRVRVRVRVQVRIRVRIRVREEESGRRQSGHVAAGVGTEAAAASLAQYISQLGRVRGSQGWGQVQG